MKRLFVSPACLRENTAELRGEDHHHLVHVLRLAEGAAVSLVDGSGLIYEGTITGVTTSATRVDIQQRIKAPEPQQPRLILVDGLARAARNEWILQKCTELGVDAFIHVVCERSVARPKATGRKLERWSEIVRQAARQSQRVRLPRLSPPVTLADGIDRASAAEVRLIACPEGAMLFEQEERLRAKPSAVAVAVGPEGGFSPHEVDLARQNGFVPVSLGPLILRTETAAIALLTLVAYLSGRLQPPPPAH